MLSVVHIDGFKPKSILQVRSFYSLVLKGEYDYIYEIDLRTKSVQFKSNIEIYLLLDHFQPRLNAIFSTLLKAAKSGEM